MTNGSMFDLTGRRALITGSSRGLGFALAKALGDAGADVVLNARNEDELNAAVSRLHADDIGAAGYVCDVTDEAAVEAMVAAIESDLGSIEILINNAGMQMRAPFLEFPISGFRDVLEVNLVAPFIVAQAVGRRMATRSSGKIVNIGSVQSQLGRPTIVPYTASKGGLALLTRGLCADLSPLGIQVNTLAPGYFATELTAQLVADEEFSAWVANRTPAGRWGEVDELGGTAVFLSSPASSFVTGQTIFVDGGMTAVV